MKILVNREERQVETSAVNKLSDILAQVNATLPQGHLVTNINLNGKNLNKNWTETGDKTYILEADSLAFEVSEAAVVAVEILKETKEFLIDLLVVFDGIAKDFRVKDDTEANAKFVRGIDSLQDFLKALGDATALLGKPLETIIVDDVLFSQYINELVTILDSVIRTQNQKDWVRLADVIEYEMMPALKKIGLLYAILDI
ncbi:MAG: hypothetical protein FWG20_05270 [Candidatus Cloacimonetes bacterium]|nr:hypothetical protein [Candidatus Cloacimonadota bacterium]